MADGVGAIFVTDATRRCASALIMPRTSIVRTIPQAVLLTLTCIEFNRKRVAQSRLQASAGASSVGIRAHNLLYFVANGVGAIFMADGVGFIRAV